ncbi:MAG: atpG [Ilumatobacteraceae bacterium]|nr:atpG [Ilumatobacteraceae bacterium]
MFTVTVHTTAAGELVVRLPMQHVAAEATTEDKGPSPIAPEVKELAWGGGAFIVFFVLMRLVLVPRVKKGMDARYGKIRGDHETADAVRASARAEVVQYDHDLAVVKAEAAKRIDAARQAVEAERGAAIAAANDRIATKRAAANAANDAAKAAASHHVRAAVADVSGLAAELATGRRPSADVIDGVVNSLMGAQ